MNETEPGFYPAEETLSFWGWLKFFRLPRTIQTIEQGHHHTYYLTVTYRLSLVYVQYADRSGAVANLTEVPVPEARILGAMAETKLQAAYKLYQSYQKLYRYLRP